jgi:serine/threonine-protein kinase
MTTTLFGQVGPYVIERPIGQGGMASVFLARDSRSAAIVALKIVHKGTDEEAREILASEQRGAELQQRFSALSRFVPKVYESGSTDDYFYIAMEYIDGEDLSQAIHRGPMPWQRAAAITIQLCEFLDEADRFETTTDSRRVLLHNDLKPRNIRLMARDEVKVLDFGAAKALSLSRKVTRNDFGSTAYLSPECLDSGERDVYSDAWSLGVLLYEMVRGRQPFHAEDTRKLEQQIRSRQPPESIAGFCPPGVEAIIAKLLAPYPADRYPNPTEIRADLKRALAGETPLALAEGWPNPLRDEPPTRRTTQLADTEPVTRATRQDRDAVPPAPPAAAAAAAAPPPRPPQSRVRWFLTRAAIVVIVGLALNEGCVASASNRLAGRVLVQDFTGLSESWPAYEELAERSNFGAVAGLERALSLQTMVLAERVIANYRTPMPTVRENQWKAARDAIRRAIPLDPGNRNMRAALRYCEGHIHRIDGEASKGRDQLNTAQEEFTEAVVAFREAAELRPNWPDPYLGLARTFIYGLEDVDRGADALEQAKKHGHALSERETTQLADGYRARGDTMYRTARTLAGLPQERDYLSRAVDAYREAISRYSTIPGFGNSAVSIRDTQRLVDRVQERLDELGRQDRRWPWE